MFAQQIYWYLKSIKIRRWLISEFIQFIYIRTMHLVHCKIFNKRKKGHMHVGVVHSVPIEAISIYIVNIEIRALNWFSSRKQGIFSHFRNWNIKYEKRES